MVRLGEFARIEVLQRITPFWLELIDLDHGGFVGAAFSRSQPIRDADKSGVLQCRILWFFSTAYDWSGDPVLLAAASHAFDFIGARFFDPDSDGVFWSVQADGRPADPQKHAYAQAFAIFGLAAYHRASGSSQALGLAKRLYQALESRAADHAFGGYNEAFNRDWSEAANERLGRPDAPKTFNTHLHLAEAYFALWEVWPDPELKARIEALLGLLMGAMFDQRQATFLQYFEADWQSLDEGLSFGHDIEAAWLIRRIAEGIGSPTAPVISPDLSRVAAQVLSKAVEPDGGVISGRGAWGEWDDGKVWWVQAEALVGFIDAFERSRDALFLAATEQVWGFVANRVSDPVDGEWRARIDRPGVAPRREFRASAWKCPYHNGRACMELAKRADLTPAAPTRT